MSTVVSLFGTNNPLEARFFPPLNGEWVQKVCPFIVLDTTKMPSDVKSTPVDVQLELTFNKDIKVILSAHVILIYDKVVTYSSFSGLVL